MPFSDTNPAVCDAYRFGRFEARVRTGYLLREGRRIKIEELPFQMLLVLLESPGQVVSKESLRDRLWGQGTFGELDSSLHVAAAKLREALGESAGEPLFIQTVRRRGYQFIGEVVPVFESAPEVAPVPGTVPATLPVELAPSESAAKDTGRKSRRLAISFAALAVLAAIVAIFIYRYTHRPLAQSRDRILLGGFANSTGDNSYNGLSHAFRVKLEESPYLSMIPDRQFRKVVKDPDSASMQEELKACVSLNGQILLTGQIVPQPPGYEVIATAWKCAGGHLLTTQKARASAKDRVLAALDQVTEQMRRRLGESESSLQKFNVPLSQATTASLAGLKAFTLGEEKRANGQEFESISDYKLAVDLDPQFALAYARLGTIYSNAAEFEQSSAYFKKAFEMRERTTDRERLYITSHYYSVTTGEIQRSIDAYELWHSLYPRDMSPASNLALAYLSIGQPERAVDLAQTAFQMDASSGFPVAVLARAYLETRNLAGLEKLCAEMGSGNSDVITLHESCFLLAFLKNDDAGMQGQLQWARGNPAESELLDEAGWVAMYRGRVTEGRRFFAEARQIAIDRKFLELAATVDLDEAGLEADFGYSREAREHALDALALAPESTNTQASAALALARAGDATRAQAEAGKAAAQAPLDTILNSAELASVQAAIQLLKHDPKAAIQALEPARPLDLCSTMGLAPAYYRGLAYLQDKEFDKAAGEFRRVIDHRSLAPDSPYIGLAEVGLGRAYQLAGDRTNALRAYHDAENIWKGADADFLPPTCMNRPENPSKA